MKHKSNTEQKVNMPNLLLIAGNGRNVGKTYLACKIIEQISKKNDVTGLKISPHFHDCDPEDVIYETDNFKIVKESKITGKDSSLMLQSGARNVFFVMVKQTHLGDAFAHLRHFISSKLIVCESGGLIEVIKPGAFLFVKRFNEQITKKHLLNYAPHIVNNDGSSIDFDFKSITITNGKFSILA